MYRRVIFLTLVTNAIASLLDGDVDLADGVRLVGVPVSNSLEDEGRSMGDSPLYKMAKFLQGHELHVKLPNLIEKEKLSQFFAESLKAVDETYKEKAVTGRGKGGGGGGSLALLGLMFAKSLGAAGIGGLGLLTMKALAVSALAFMLSAIVGVKKLASHDDHDEHQVIYAGHGHHRRRRSPLPYRVTGRGKGGGGGGSLALLGLMFAKSLGAAGIGGLGLLTMKALAVSALAFMLSAIVGVKKLASHDDHDEHQVIYAGHGHHRRRRSPLPYRGWTQYQEQEE